MRYRFFVLFFLLFSLAGLAQTWGDSPSSINTDRSAKSRILSASGADTTFFHVQYQDGLYDPSRNNLPYIVVDHPTDYEKKAIPKLQVKRSVILPAAHQSVFKKYFLSFLTNDFELQPLSSLHKNRNLNHHKLVPFRLNSLGEVEELLDYEITWTESQRPLTAAKGKSPFKNTSVLSTGTWYKISVAQTGIYRIGRAQLAAMGINTSKLDPRNIRLYGNGGAMVPERNSDFRWDDLEENAIRVVGEEDGSFDNADYVLFYGLGTDEWFRKDTAGLKFVARKSIYSDSSYYFITVDQGPGKRIGSKASENSSNISTTTYDYYRIHEQNVLNLGKSGRELFGEYFDLITSYRFVFDEGNFVKGDTIAAEARMAGNVNQETDFSIVGNGLDFQVSTPGSACERYCDFAGFRHRVAKSLNTNDALIEVLITKTSPRSVGWLDKLTVNARRALVVNSQQFNFRDTRVTGPGKICNFTLSKPLNSQLVIWNVTDHLNPVAQVHISNPTSASFNANCAELQEYCVAPVSGFYTPGYAGKVANQNLHALNQADYLIISHPLFLKEAERLGQFHQKMDKLSYAVASVDEIYNEFSSGKLDAAAIRDFIRMVYLRNNMPGGRPLKYVVLMGDGSFFNKSRNLVNNSNFVPTYQSQSSLSPHTSLTTDDFFVMMDDEEGYRAEDTGRTDVGIGRFPCRKVSEVQGILNKIEHYYAKQFNIQSVINDPNNCNSLNEGTMGDWRNWLLFLGDDGEGGDGATHMAQSDRLVDLVQSIDRNYNFDKIYLDAYQRFSTPGGGRYPDASADFLRRIAKGALIFNYTGHGGEVGLTAERMIDIDIINGMDNLNRLSLFITATCEFSRYDDPARTSAGELSLLNPKGGAVALFTTCRLAYSGPNEKLNKVTLEKLFTRLPDGSMPRLGDAINLTKSDARTETVFYTNFHLLGDPALRLAYPEDQVITSSIDGIKLDTLSSDTLSALAKITITGYVADRSGNKIGSYSGIAYPTVFDKEQEVVCLINVPLNAASTAADGSLVPFRFKSQKNILYKGKALIQNGEFSYTFIVPKDISFAPGPGKISYYATNGVNDAHGFYDQIVVGGSAKNAFPDNDGPQVHLYLNDKNFINGGTTNEAPVLYADLTDSSGVNTLGSGIGHDISVVLDENTTRPLILNDYYEASLNSYQSGRVRYPYNKLAEGNHRLTFRVWDIQNNSSTAHTDFVVAPSAELALKHVLNYPNPFTTNTKFFFEHNQPCKPLKVNIQVFTVSGKLVKTLQQTVVCEGFRTEGITWDGRDDFGDRLGRGVYVYKLSILDVENKKAEKIEKLVILN